MHWAFYNVNQTADLRNVKQKSFMKKCLFRILYKSHTDLVALDEDLKQPLICQDNPKDAWRDLAFKLSIKFTLNLDPQNIQQQAYHSNVDNYHPSG